jgi:hypothetical protein
MSINISDSTIAVAKRLHANLKDYDVVNIADDLVYKRLGISHATYRRALAHLYLLGALDYSELRPGPNTPNRHIVANRDSWVWQALGLEYDEPTYNMVPDLEAEWLL